MNEFINDYLNTIFEDALNFISTGSGNALKRIFLEADLTKLDAIKFFCLSDSVFEITVPRSASIKYKQGISSEQLIDLEKENIALLDVAAQLIVDCIGSGSEPSDTHENSFNQISLPSPSPGCSQDSSELCTDSVDFNQICNTIAPCDEVAEILQEAQQSETEISSKKISDVNQSPERDTLFSSQKQTVIMKSPGKYRRKTIILPLKLWVRIPLNNLTHKLCLKLKKNIQHQYHKLLREQMLNCLCPQHCSTNICQLRQSRCSFVFGRESAVPNLQFERSSCGCLVGETCIKKNNLQEYHFNSPENPMQTIINNTSNINQREKQKTQSEVNVSIAREGDLEVIHRHLKQGQQTHFRRKRSNGDDKNSNDSGDVWKTTAMTKTATSNVNIQAGQSEHFHGTWDSDNFRQDGFNLVGDLMQDSDETETDLIQVNHNMEIYDNMEEDSKSQSKISPGDVDLRRNSLTNSCDSDILSISKVCRSSANSHTKQVCILTPCEKKTHYGLLGDQPASQAANAQNIAKENGELDREKEGHCSSDLSNRSFSPQYYANKKSCKGVGKNHFVVPPTSQVQKRHRQQRKRAPNFCGNETNGSPCAVSLKEGIIMGNVKSPCICLPKQSLTPELNIDKLMQEQSQNYSSQSSKDGSGTNANDETPNSSPGKACKNNRTVSVQNSNILRAQLKRQLFSLRREKKLSKMSKTINESLSSISETDLGNISEDSDISTSLRNPVSPAYKEKRKSSRISGGSRKSPSQILSNNEVRLPQGKKISFRQYRQIQKSSKNCIACWDSPDDNVNANSHSNSSGNQINYGKHNALFTQTGRLMIEAVEQTDMNNSCSEVAISLGEIEEKEENIIGPEKNIGDKLQPQSSNSPTQMPDDSGLGLEDEIISAQCLNASEDVQLFRSDLGKETKEAMGNDSSLKMNSESCLPFEHLSPEPQADPNARLISDESDSQIDPENDKLNLPYIFDERDCLSIFDEFDITIDDDLFGATQESEDNKLSSDGLLGENKDQRESGKNAVPVTDEGFAKFHRKRQPASADVDEERKTQVDLSENDGQNGVLSSSADNDGLGDCDLSTLLTKVPKELVEPLWQSLSNDTVTSYSTTNQSVPKEDVYVHTVETVKAMLQKGNIAWAMLSYRDFQEKAPGRLLPPNLLRELLHNVMDRGGIVDAFCILNKITEQNLFDRVICNRIIRLCWSQQAVYTSDLEKIFFAFVSLNITLDSDCKLYMLHLFYNMKRPALLWEMLCLVNECDGFQVPASIMVQALCYVRELPHQELVTKYEQFVHAARLDAFRHIDKGTLNQLSAQLCRIAPSCSPSLIQLIKGPAQRPPRSTMTEPKRYQHLPVEEMELSQQEEYKSYFHRISGCAYSLNWAYLGETFVDLCNQEAPTNRHFVPAYVTALENTNNAQSTLANVQDFLAAVKSEMGVNVLLTLDTCTLSQIVCQVILTLFSKGHMDIATHLTELVLAEKLLEFVDCSTDENHQGPQYSERGVIITALQACCHARNFETACQLIEENKSLLQTLSSPWLQEFLQRCVNELVLDITDTDDQCYEELLMLRLLIESCSSMLSSILKGVPNLFEVIISSFLDVGGWISSLELLQVLQQVADVRHVSTQLLRKFLSGYVDAGIDLSPELYQCCTRYIDYPVQSVLKRPTRLIYIQLGMTVGEIQLSQESYLRNLYSQLYSMVAQGQSLSKDDLFISVKFIPGTLQSLDVPFLGSAPRTMSILQAVVVKTFKTMEPPIDSVINHETEMVDLDPKDLGKFLQNKDISEGRPKLFRQLQGLMKNVL